MTPDEEYKETLAWMKSLLQEDQYIRPPQMQVERFSIWGLIAEYPWIVPVLIFTSGVLYACTASGGPEPVG